MISQGNTAETCISWGGSNHVQVLSAIRSSNLSRHCEAPTGGSRNVRYVAVMRNCWRRWRTRAGCGDTPRGDHMRVCGKDIKIQGRLVRIASPELDSYELLNDPEAVLDGL